MREPYLPEPTHRRIVRLRDGAGKTWQAIADLLNGDGTPTALRRGARRWWPATVRAVYRYARRRETARRA